jgi:hypothetical protein
MVTFGIKGTICLIGVTSAAGVDTSASSNNSQISGEFDRERLT